MRWTDFGVSFFCFFLSFRCSLCLLQEEGREEQETQVQVFLPFLYLCAQGHLQDGGGDTRFKGQSASRKKKRKKRNKEKKKRRLRWGTHMW